ncbi:MAG: hypothetical protein U0805_20465 [Pirellulales bacterium]
MAGKMRFAAKVFLGSSLLASMAGGGYYYTTHGLTLPTFLQAKPEKPAASTGELDAVASAWSEPTSSPTAKSSAGKTPDPALSSPVARSAQPVAVAADSSAIAGDRYALETPAVSDAAKTEPSPEPLVATERSARHNDATDTTPIVANVTESTPPKDASKATVGTAAAEPTPTTKVELVQAVSQPAVTENDKPAAAAEKSPIARGQEPQDDPTGKQGGAANDLNSTFDGIAADTKPLAEPQPLAQPAQAGKLDSGPNRAKQAFGNTPTTGAADRYGDTAPSSREPQPLPTGGAINNPFAAGNTPPAPASSGLIEPLPPSPAELNAGTAHTGASAPANDLSPPRGGLRPLEGSTANSTASRDLSSRPLGQSPPRPLGASPYSRNLQSPPSGMNNAANDITPLPAGDGSGKPGEKALEGPQQPTLVIQKFAPAEIQVGKTAKFVLQIRNAGNQSADGVTIRDEVPQGTKLISTSPNATPEGSQIVWQIGKLSPGEDRTVEMQLMPTSEGDIGSVATVSYTAQASVKTRCTMPQLAIRMTAASEVMVGSQQHVKIEIKNPGSGAATGVMLFENVPPNVKHVAGPALEFEIGTLRPGETRELDLVLTAEKAGKVVNTLTAKADGNLQVQQQVEFEVIAPALSVGLNGPERRYLERPATYEVSVENPGTAAAHDVQIVTKLPKGMKFVRANNMGEYDAATHAVYWSLAELPKGETGKVELVAMPTETGPQTLQVESHAQQGLSDRKQREIVVEGLAAIMFEVRDLEDPIEVGGETGYEIRVVNQGTKAATNVQVAVEIPPGLKLISAEGETAHKAQDGRLLFDPIQQLAPKADTVFRIKAQGLQPGDQRITVQVNTDDLQQPIRREESTRVFGDQ